MPRRPSKDVERCVGDTIERNCTACGQWKSSRDFSSIKHANGTAYKEGRCHACRRDNRRTARVGPVLERMGAKLARYPRAEVLAWLESTQLKLSEGVQQPC